MKQQLALFTAPPSRSGPCCYESPQFYDTVMSLRRKGFTVFKGSRHSQVNIVNGQRMTSAQMHALDLKTKMREQA